MMHSPVDGYLGCTIWGTITNKSAMNVHVQIIVYTHTFFFLE